MMGEPNECKALIVWTGPIYFIEAMANLCIATRTVAAQTMTPFALLLAGVARALAAIEP